MLPLSQSANTWAGALGPGVEFATAELPILAGALPEHLRGTLYRNGPACLERGGERTGHWFDGDGAILAVRFGGGGTASACYRYVRTAGYMAETARDRYLFPNYGQTAAGPVWNNWLRPVKNVANTSVLALPDKLLALWEAGWPHGLNLESLETIAPDGLGWLEAGDPFSAHPKRDPETGEIYNFGVRPGGKSVLQLYRCDRAGSLLKRNEFPLDGVPLLHDFVMAGRYLVFFVSPVRLNLLAGLLGLKSFGDALTWQPKLGTQILLFDRATLELVAQSTADPWYQWHFANGAERNGEIIVEFVRFPDFTTNQNLKEAATGRIQTPAAGQLWRARLEPQTARVLGQEPLSDRTCEFPIVAAADTGQDWRYTYLGVHRAGTVPGSELIGAVAAYDRQTQQLTVADPGPDCYPSEPIFVPDPQDPATGWLLTVSYDGGAGRSEVWVYPRDRLAEGPICRLGLPEIVPHSFHGTWRPA